MCALRRARRRQVLVNKWHIVRFGGQEEEPYLSLRSQRGGGRRRAQGGGGARHGAHRPAARRRRALIWPAQAVDDAAGSMSHLCLFVPYFLH